MKLVTRVEEAIQGIERYQLELSSNPKIQDRMSYARAWYAHQRDNGDWIFGPSKFIGYTGMDAASYTNDKIHKDGRKTENRLQTWFDTLEANLTSFEVLSDRLNDFFMQYGKNPSKIFRINTIKPDTKNLVRRDNHVTNSYDKDVVDLIALVAAKLSKQELQILKEKLNAI